MDASWMSFALLGVGAGILTTVSGMGGGFVLLLSFALWTDPLSALALTAPALLIGNLHRAWMLRRGVDRPTAGSLVRGAFPGSLLGGLVASAAPRWLLSGVMLAMAGLALARVLGLRWRPPTGATSPFAFFTGFVTATGGGAGVLQGPFLLARGLTGPTFVGTGAVGAVAMHLGRILAYGLGGAITARTLATGAGLAVAITVGNLLGKRISAHMGARMVDRIQVGVMVLSVGLALLGVRG